MTGRTLPVVTIKERKQKIAHPEYNHDPYAEERLGMGDSDESRQVRNLSTDRLTSSLMDIREGLDEVFASINAVGKFELNEVKLTLEVTAKGGFALIGSVEAGARGGVTLTFVPPK